MDLKYGGSVLNDFIFYEESSKLIEVTSMGDGQRQFIVRRNTARSWDTKDAEYRRTSLSDITDNDNMIMEHPELRATYNEADHRYEFDYRGHSFHVEERMVMWEDYPMDVLARELREKLREIDKKEDFDWEPRSDKLSHGELLAALEGLRCA